MLETLFRGVFDADWIVAINISDFFLCIGIALGLGLIISICYMRKSNYTQSFVMTISLLPAIVCVVIMLVNGNLGAGVAIAGAFSLIRFRSIAGTASEICTLFFAMAVGLLSGVGYLGFALAFTFIICCMFMIYNSIDFGMKKGCQRYKTIRIVIPEDLDYTGVFDDIFDEYVDSFDLVNVKTTNMGSIFKLTYEVILKDITKEKEMMDALRCRNGNLEINISRTSTRTEL